MTQTVAGLAVILALAGALPAAAADAPGGCTGPMRKINIGVAVSPPNVVHTTPYVAKALGYFAKRCIDATILQFDGGASAAAVAAVAQGTAISALTETPIAQGVKAKQIWMLAPRPPQDYFVAADIKTPADLKGKRLSAAGGVGAFNWLMGREMLRLAGLNVNDAKFIAQGTAGRLPGLLAGQLDGVVLHPEDVYIAEHKKPGTHSLGALADLLPNLSFNAYGAADSLIAHDRPLLVDTIAAMIEANRTMYRDRDKVLPIIMDATQKPKDAVEYAWGVITKRCIWSVNDGFDKARTLWSIQFAIDNGDIQASRRPTFEDVVDMSLAKDALAAAGGPVTINNCKD
jgi:ABC-type nitrate/sulfonate/bicarbonate transport system substrate-binding protein